MPPNCLSEQSTVRQRTRNRSSMTRRMYDYIHTYIRNYTYSRISSRVFVQHIHFSLDIDIEICIDTIEIDLFPSQYISIFLNFCCITWILLNQFVFRSIMARAIIQIGKDALYSSCILMFLTIVSNFE